MEMPERLQAAVDALCGVLSANRIDVFQSRQKGLRMPLGKRTYIIVTGPLSFHQWRYDDEVSLVCLTETSQALFWSVVAEKLDLGPDVKLPTGGVMELSAAAFSKIATGAQGALSTFVTLSRRENAGCKFYLRYCPLPADFEAESMGVEPMPDYAVSQNSPAIKKTITMLRGLQRLALDITCLSGGLTTFQRAYDKFRSWTEACGLFSVNFGFLDSRMPVNILYHAFTENKSQLQHAHPSERDSALLKQSLQYLKAIAENEKAMETPTGQSPEGVLSAEAKDAVISALQHQSVDLATASQNAFKNLLREFVLFVKIDCEHWGASMVDRATFENEDVPAYMEHCIKLFQDSTFQQTCRPWPMSFTKEGDINTFVRVIGLVRASEAATVNASELHSYAQQITMSKDDREEWLDSVCAFLGATVVTAHEFLDFVSSDDKELIDTLEKNIAALPVELSEFRPRKKSVTFASSSQIADTTDTLTSSLSDLHITNMPATQASPAASGPSPSTTAIIDTSDTTTPGTPKRKANAQRPASPPKKFRDAHSVISRLRFDDKHMSIEYEVGYIDRFQDALVWMPLANWGGKATEEEDFIPIHRLRQVRRAEDGEVVWDRENRIDKT